MKKISAIFIFCYLVSISSISAKNDDTTSTTTLKPTTPTPVTPSTTTAPTSTTPKPTPVPAPTEGHWEINNGTNNASCIMAKLAVQISVNYLPKDSNTTMEQLIDIPPNATASGTCGDTEAMMKLTWDTNNSLTFHFKEMKDMNLYNLNQINVKLDPKSFVNFHLDEVLSLQHMSAHYNTSVGKSYRCIRLQHFDLKTNIANTTGLLKVSGLQFQAFRTDNTTTNFGAAEDCAFETPDIVPIAVGCVLALLVVIVLTAYLISRRRSQSRGYLSM